MWQTGPPLPAKTHGTTNTNTDTNIPLCCLGRSNPLGSPTVPPLLLPFLSSLLSSLYPYPSLKISAGLLPSKQWKSPFTAIVKGRKVVVEAWGGDSVAEAKRLEKEDNGVNKYCKHPAELQGDGTQSKHGNSID